MSTPCGIISCKAMINYSLSFRQRRPTMFCIYSSRIKTPPTLVCDDINSKPLVTYLQPDLYKTDHSKLVHNCIADRHVTKQETKVRNVAQFSKVVIL